MKKFLIIGVAVAFAVCGVSMGGKVLAQEIGPGPHGIVKVAQEIGPGPLDSSHVVATIVGPGPTMIASSIKVS